MGSTTERDYKRPGTGEDGQGTAEEWGQRGTASRTEPYQGKGSVREKGWAAAAERYRQKDRDRDKVTMQDKEKRGRKKEGQIKMWAGKETERDKKYNRERGDRLSSSYSINIEHLFFKRT